MKMITVIEYDFKYSIRMHTQLYLKNEYLKKKGYMDTGVMQDRILKSTVTYVSVYMYWLYIVRTKACEQTKMSSLIEAKQYVRGLIIQMTQHVPIFLLSTYFTTEQFKSPMWCLDSCQRHIQNPHNQTFLCQMRSNKCWLIWRYLI